MSRDDAQPMDPRTVRRPVLTPSGLGERAIVCLHGLGRTPADWDAARDWLSSLGDVRAPALPPRPAGALALLDELVTPGAIVIGHSMGAVLAMRLAAWRPRPLTAAVLTGSFHRPARNGRGTGAALRDYAAHRVAFVRGRRSQRTATADRGAIAPLASLVAQTVRRADHEAALARCAAAVLIVHARDDHHVPVDFAIAAARRHPEWELALLAAGGHHAHVSDPVSWMDAVAPWLAARGTAPDAHAAERTRRR